VFSTVKKKVDLEKRKKKKTSRNKYFNSSFENYQILTPLKSTWVKVYMQCPMVRFMPKNPFT